MDKNIYIGQLKLEIQNQSHELARIKRLLELQISAESAPANLSQNTTPRLVDSQDNVRILVRRNSDGGSDHIYN